LDLQISKTTLQDLTSEVELYNMIGHDPAYDVEDDTDDSDEEMIAANEEIYIIDENDEIIDESDVPGLMEAVSIPRIENLGNDQEEGKSLYSYLSNL
jgi:hypothetical protein